MFASWRGGVGAEENRGKNLTGGRGRRKKHIGMEKEIMFMRERKLPWICDQSAMRMKRSGIMKKSILLLVVSFAVSSGTRLCAEDGKAVLSPASSVFGGALTWKKNGVFFKLDGKETKLEGSETRKSPKEPGTRSPGEKWLARSLNGFKGGTGLAVLDLSAGKEGLLQGRGFHGAFEIRRRVRESWRSLGKRERDDMFEQTMVGAMCGGDEWLHLSDLVGKYKNHEEAKSLLAEWRKSDDPQVKKKLEKVKNKVAEHLDDCHMEIVVPVNLRFCGWLGEDKALFWDDFRFYADSRMGTLFFMVDCKEKTVSGFFKYLGNSKGKLKAMGKQRRERYIYLHDYGAKEGEEAEGQEIPCGFKMVWSNEPLSKEAKELVKAKVKGVIESVKDEGAKARLLKQIEEMKKHPADERPF